MINLDVETKTFISNLKNDMNISNISTPQWNTIDWSPLNPLTSVSTVIDEPNKVSNKYTLPMKISCQNSIKILF